MNGFDESTLRLHEGGWIGPFPLDGRYLLDATITLGNRIEEPAIETFERYASVAVNTDRLRKDAPDLVSVDVDLHDAVVAREVRPAQTCSDRQHEVGFAHQRVELGRPEPPTRRAKAERVIVRQRPLALRRGYHGGL